MTRAGIRKAIVRVASVEVFGDARTARARARREAPEACRS
jgi:hypothetical protein